MFGVFCSVTLLVETGVSIASLASVVITGLVSTVSILLFRLIHRPVRSKNRCSCAATRGCPVFVLGIVAASCGTTGNRTYIHEQ